jgi:hypothetical protein
VRRITRRPQDSSAAFTDAGNPFRGGSMVSLTSLLIPILLSAFFVWIASSIIHMLLGYHNSDFGPVPDEEGARAALRYPPGDYVVPYSGSMEAMKKPEFAEKMKAGPVVFMTVLPNNRNFMGSALVLWFIYCAVVSLFAAYIAGRALAPGADYLDVFRFAGATAFAGYVLALWQNTIWYRRSATTNLKNTFDGLVYALITAGTFGWLWPS